MGYINISDKIVRKVSNRVRSIDRLPDGIEKYSDFNIVNTDDIPNEDKIKEYMQVASRGEDEDYMEYLENDDSVDDVTLNKAKSIDVSNTITEDDIRQEITDIYSTDSIRETADKLQEDINQVIRENNLQSDIPSESIRTIKRLGKIIKKVVEKTENTIYLLGVTGSYLVSRLGALVGFAGVVLAVMSPVITLPRMYMEGSLMPGLRILGGGAAYMIVGAITAVTFHEVGKAVAKFYEDGGFVN